MKFYCLQHVPFESAANIGVYLRAHKIETTDVKLFDGDNVPGKSEVDGLVVMGGPMSVNDEADFSWMKAEKELIGQTIKADKPVLGICLGAQMIAEVLGGRVSSMGYREIGYFEVSRIGDDKTGCAFNGLASNFKALHWHGELFSIPDKAVHLARSKACENQAFEYGSALALQFHLEMNEQGLVKILENCAAELDGGRFVQNREKIIELEQKHRQEHTQLLEKLLDNWLV